MQLSEFALYDKEGVRQNVGLTNVTAGTSAERIPSGAFSPLAVYDSGTNNTQPEKNLFDDNPNTKWCAVRNNMKDSLNSPKNWRIVTMHLPDESNPIVSYNLRTAEDCAPRNPNAWSLEASDDGEHWRVVSEKTNVPVPGDGEWKVWYNEGVPYALEDTSDSRSYSVAAGATLDLNGGLLTCGDLTGAGTVKGGSVLASGGVDSSLVLDGVELRGETEIVGDKPATPDSAFWAEHPALLAAAGGQAHIHDVRQDNARGR